MSATSRGKTSSNKNCSPYAQVRALSVSGAFASEARDASAESSYSKSSSSRRCARRTTLRFVRAPTRPHARGGGACAGHAPHTTHQLHAGTRVCAQRRALSRGRAARRTGTRGRNIVAPPPPLGRHACALPPPQRGAPPPTHTYRHRHAHTRTHARSSARSRHAQRARHARAKTAAAVTRARTLPPAAMRAGAPPPGSSSENPSLRSSACARAGDAGGARTGQARRGGQRAIRTITVSKLSERTVCSACAAKAKSFEWRRVGVMGRVGRANKYGRVWLGSKGRASSELRKCHKIGMSAVNDVFQGTCGEANCSWYAQCVQFSQTISLHGSQTARHPDSHSRRSDR